MSERTWIADLKTQAGGPVRIAGWLHRYRELSHVTFLVIRDRTGLAQVVVEADHVTDEIAALSPETVVAIDGLAVAEERAPGGVEIHEPSVTVLAAPVEPPPFDLFRPTLNAQLPTLLDHAAIGLRHPRHQAAFRVAAASTAGFRAALEALGFTEIHTPKIVAFASETGATVFPVDYFGRTAYLAQSPQLYKQIMVGVFERVYEIGPVFRAEPHATARHLSEYVSLDAELGFISDYRDVMRVARAAVAGMIEGIRQHAAGAIELLGVTLPRVPDEIPAVDFREAQLLLEKHTGEDLADELDLAPSHERWLTAWAEREYDSEFLFVTGFPLAKRPFYTYPDPNRREYSNGFDLLFRGLEVITGGQRLHIYDDYIEALRARGEDPTTYAGYLEAFRYGMPPHGGFAIGLERWVARLVGAANIRETSLFPRDINRLTP